MTTKLQMVKDFPGIALNQCGWSVCEPGHLFGPSVRNHYLIHYVLKGKGILETKGKRYSIGENQCFMIFPEEETTYYASDTNPWEYYWVGFSGSFCDSMLTKTSLSTNNHVFTMLESPDNIVNCVKNIYASTHLQSGSTLKSMGLLMQFLSYILDSTKTACSKNITQIQKTYITKAIYYIQENYKKNANIHDMSVYIGIDRSYIYRIFKEYYGISPSKYIILMKIDECCRLLDETNLSISQIAMDTGFSSSSHMCSDFKKIKGITPTQYRKYPY